MLSFLVVFGRWFVPALQTYDKFLNSQYVDWEKCELFKNNWIFQYLTLSFYTFNFTSVVRDAHRGRRDNAKDKIKNFRNKEKKRIQSLIFLLSYIWLLCEKPRWTNASTGVFLLHHANDDAF